MTYSVFVARIHEVSSIIVYSAACYCDLLSVCCKKEAYAYTNGDLASIHKCSLPENGEFNVEEEALAVTALGSY